MKNLLIVAGLMLALTSCGNRNANKTTDDTTRAAEPAIVDIHNAQNSLSYAGKYSGTLPCADCSGIATVITLDYNGNYTKEATYLGKGDGKPFKTEGKYEWNDKGNEITLKGGTAPEVYWVSENRIVLLDEKGNKVTGELADKYVLTQVEHSDK